MAHVLTLNAGSSSLKFGLFEKRSEPVVLATGIVDRIGGAAVLRLEDAGGETLAERELGHDAGDHAAALRAALEAVGAHFADADVVSVGHRIVHGGTDFTDPVKITGDILPALERLVPFAPLHQPHNLAGVRAAMDEFPEARQVGCFDTAFHRGQPFESDTFALPRRYFDAGVRRYGFHGLSYQYISGNLAGTEPDLQAGRVIVAHLGNGASMCAMRCGRSVDSSMGFTALDGLPMGTRCGQVDPGVLLYMMEQEGLGAEEIGRILYHESGLLGLSGISGDMRTLLGSDQAEARQAVDCFTFRIRREIGAMAAVLGGLDAVVFTGGIGENAAPVRADACAGLEWLGVRLDADRNTAGERVVSAADSRVSVMVIPTDEELVIARAAAAAD